MFHGIVKTKKAIGDIPAGTEGVITAFLPEQKIFAVGYKVDKRGFITYKDHTFEQFKKRVEILHLKDYLNEYWEE